MERSAPEEGQVSLPGSRPMAYGSSRPGIESEPPQLQHWGILNPLAPWGMEQAMPWRQAGSRTCCATAGTPSTGSFKGLEVLEFSESGIFEIKRILPHMGDWALPPPGRVNVSTF